MLKTTQKRLLAKKQDGMPITALTAYDASFAQCIDAVGIDIVLVGDSLGTTIQGARDTLAVTTDMIAYHIRAVRAGTNNALLAADLPFLSYTNVASAAESCRTLCAAGAETIKIEIHGADTEKTVATLCEHGVSIWAHIGLLPQQVAKGGSLKQVGRKESDAAALVRQAQRLEKSGVAMLLVEHVPAAVGKAIAESVAIPVIGIGAGGDCDGQILVLYDVIGLSRSIPPFSRSFIKNGIAEAVCAYKDAVIDRSFP